MNDIEIEQLVGRSEEQIIQGAFKELRSKITPQPKRFKELLTKLEQLTPVNVTPSPYARYIKGWSTGVVKKGIGSVCTAALVLGVWYGFSYYNSTSDTEAEQTSNTAKNDLALADAESFDFEHEDYVINDDAEEERVLVGIMESDAESIINFNSLYDEKTEE